MGKRQGKHRKKGRESAPSASSGGCPRKSSVSVSNRVEMPKSRFISTYFDLENEYNAILSAEYAENSNFTLFLKLSTGLETL